MIAGRRLAALGLTVLVIASLSGCAVADAIAPPIDQAIYATAPEAKAADGTVAAPSWVPDEAQMVRVKTNTSLNGTIMTYTMPAAPTPIGQPCTPEQMAAVPKIDDTWWLQQTPTDGVNCQDGWHIWYNSPQVYAWKS